MKNIVLRIGKYNINTNFSKCIVSFKSAFVNNDFGEFI